jgi:hypothetical protein
MQVLVSGKNIKYMCTVLKFFVAVWLTITGTYYVYTTAYPLCKDYRSLVVIYELRNLCLIKHVFRIIETIALWTPSLFDVLTSVVGKYVSQFVCRDEPI